MKNRHKVKLKCISKLPDPPAWQQHKGHCSWNPGSLIFSLAQQSLLATSVVHPFTPKKNDKYILISTTTTTKTMQWTEIENTEKQQSKLN